MAGKIFKQKKLQMKKTILITGATGAVGRATALELAKRGETVILLSRNKDKLEALKNEIVKKSGNNNVDYIAADFSQISSVKKAAEEFKQRYDRLNVLIHTASVFKRKREISKDNLEMMFAVNHLAVFVLTNELLELMKKSTPSRIITLTAPSTTKIKFDDLQGTGKFSPFSYFGASKMTNLLFTYALARRLEGTGVSALAFFPGLVKSELTMEMPPVIRFLIRAVSRQADKPAKTLSHLAEDPDTDNFNGKFFKYNGKIIKSSGYSYDEQVQKKLWDISINLSKLATVQSTQQVQTEMVI
jgi:NAD(P)-dependent dehydrogenase (short-subunit alcohol dehydrogenase family)